MNKEKIDARNEAYNNHIKEIKEVFNVDYTKLSSKEKNYYSNKLAVLKDPSINKRKISYNPETHKNLHKIHRTKC